MADAAAKAERQIRVLERKLRRSEESRAHLEEAKDRFDSLYATLRWIESKLADEELWED